MSSQPNSQNAATSSDPKYGVRNRSEHSRRVHRIDPESGGLEPACCRKYEDAEFKRCHIERLTAFNRFDRCQNPECFGEAPEPTDDEKELITDGGRSAEHHLDSAADQLEAAYEKRTGWEKEAIGELRKDLASLQGIDVPNNAPTDSDANQNEWDYEQCTEIPKCRNCEAEFAGHNPAESCPHCGTTRWLADRDRSATETDRPTEGKR